MKASELLGREPPSQLDRIEQMLKTQKAMLAVLLERTEPKVKRTNKRKAVEYSDAFNELWVEYPERNGGNDKKAAHRAWSARNEEMIELEYFGGWAAMFEGVIRYRNWCDATNITKTSFVMLTSTFFGPADPPNWTLAWDIPKPEAAKFPTKIADVLKWMEANGMEARPGENNEAVIRRAQAEWRRQKEQPE